MVGTQHLGGPAGLGEWPGFEGVVEWANEGKGYFPCLALESN